MAAPNPIVRMARKGLDDIQRVTFGLWTRWNGWGWGKLRMLLPSARFDWEAEASDPWRNSTVALGLAWLGDRFPRPTIQLSRLNRSGEHVPVGRNPIIDLWNRPNPYYTRRTMEKAIGLSLKTDGNAFIFKMRDRLGRVNQLWWLPHFRVFPTWPSDGSTYIDGYRVRVDGRNFYHIPAEDVIHIRDGIDPWNERLGLAALKAAIREVVTLNLANGYAAALMKNSGIPGLAFVPKAQAPVRPDKEAADRIKERFVEEYGGDLIGSPIVAAGPYEIVKIGFSPEELTLDKLPQPAEARVAAAIGVAAMSLGLPDPNKTYSNLAEANRSSWGTVVAIQELISEAIQHQLLPERIQVPTGISNGLDPLAYAFDYDYAHIQELQESLDAIHLRTREDWKAGVIRLNEAREQLGYDPDPDGDRFYPNTGSEGDAAAMQMQAALKQPPEKEAEDGQGPNGADEDGGGGDKALLLTGGNGHARRWSY